MEELLVEANSALEGFVTAALSLGAAYQRRGDFKGSQEGLKKWTQEVHDCAKRFNESEFEWLTQARVISGKIRLYFGDESDQFEKQWCTIINQSEGTCQQFYRPGFNYQVIWAYMSDLREKKNDLLNDMQKEIDRFVLEELEYTVVA